MTQTQTQFQQGVTFNIPDLREIGKRMPPHILFGWLNYIFENTGVWLEPPAGSSASAAPTPTPFVGVPGTAMPPGHSPTVPVALPGANPVGPGAVIQYPFPQMVSVALVAEEENAKKARNRATGYRYLDSPYYQAAKSLIEKHAAVPIDPSMLYGCTLVLSLVLAWCNFPLFKTGGREGRWMTLGFDHCTRELKMRSASFKAYLTELERAGLVLPGRVATGIISSEEFERLRYDAAELGKDVGGGETGFWHARALQHTNNIYQLKVFPTSALEEFNPFQMSGKHLGNTWEGPGGASGAGNSSSEGGEKGRETRGKHHVTTSEGPGRADMVFPGGAGLTESYSLNKVVEVEDKTPLFISEKEDSNKPRRNRKSNPEATNRLEQRIANLDTLPEARTKFDFLVGEVAFEGFTFEDGRRGLDRRGAYRLAVLEDVSLDEMKQRFQEVTRMWQERPADFKKNPVSALYYAIWNRVDLNNEVDPATDFAASVAQLNRQARSEKEGANQNDNGNPAANPTQRRRVLAIDDRRGMGAPGGKNSGGYYSGGSRSGHIRRPDGFPTRFGNPDITDYNDW